MKKVVIVLINLVLMIVAWKMISGRKTEPEDVKIKKRSVIENFDFEEKQTISLAKGDYLGIKKISGEKGFWLGNGLNLQLVDMAAKVLKCIEIPEKILGISLVNGKRIIAIGKRTIYRLDLDGEKTSLKSWQRGIKRSHFTSVCTDSEKIYICDAGTKMVCAYNQSDGERVWASSGMNKFAVPKPYFMLGINPDGELWVVNPGRQRCEQLDLKTGKYLAFWKPEKKSFIGCCDPALMAAVSGGRFVIMVKRALKMRFYTPAGKKETLVTDMRQFNPGKFSYDMCVDKDENVYVLDNHRDQIRVFSKPLSMKVAEESKSSFDESDKDDAFIKSVLPEKEKEVKDGQK